RCRSSWVSRFFSAACLRRFSFSASRLATAWPPTSSMGRGHRRSLPKGLASRGWWLRGTPMLAQGRACASKFRRRLMRARRRVDTDTLYARGAPFVSYALRVRLERDSVDTPSPSVRLLTASVSDFSYSAGVATSAASGGDAVELNVPTLSQEVHARQYPQWGG